MKRKKSCLSVCFDFKENLYRCSNEKPSICLQIWHLSLSLSLPSHSLSHWQITSINTNQIWVLDFTSPFFDLISKAYYYGHRWEWEIWYLLPETEEETEWNAPLSNWLVEWMNVVSSMSKSTDVNSPFDSMQFYSRTVTFLAPSHQNHDRNRIIEATAPELIWGPISRAFTIT